jgi:transcription initiation factor IIE alpha subunit
MNKQMLKEAGFDREVKLIEEGRCPCCGEIVNEEDFRDEPSKKEHKISGMCQSCQDSVFED